jgi:hypothetical protein
VLLGAADIYMIGDGAPQCSVGDMLARGIAYSQLNVQTTLQLTGGTLTKALALHVAAVLPSATGHSINLDDQYEEDITTERIPVTDGFSPVPNGPGLGFEVDEKALARFAANRPPELPKHIGILHLPDGHDIYTPYEPGVGDVPRFTGHEEGAIRGISFELWEDDGSEEFTRMHQRLGKERIIMEDRPRQSARRRS